MTDARVDALVAEVAKIDQDEFTVYGGGWQGEIGTALVDAVFSIRARYQAKDPTKGVYGRLQTFREKHPHATRSLDALAEVGSGELELIMGSTKTAQRLKSDCVIEAAENLLGLEPATQTAEDLQGADDDQVKRAYTSVSGLGWVTYEYFRMLLGKQGVKADSMIVRFVNSALEVAGYEAVDASAAHELVGEAHRVDDRGVGLSAYDHAIWRAKGELVIEEDSEA